MTFATLSIRVNPPRTKRDDIHVHGTATGKGRYSEAFDTTVLNDSDRSTW